MKVPIMYKSSDRYNAGTDVIYDDDSKLQYAPFIYATTESGDNGDSGGDGDEEGEDTMIVIFDGNTGTLNKSFKDLKDAVNSGKTVIAKIVNLDDETGYDVNLLYLVILKHYTGELYYASFGSLEVNLDTNTAEASSLTLQAETETENMHIDNQPNS